jgi:hypothetical protein
MHCPQRKSDSRIHQLQALSVVTNTQFKVFKRFPNTPVSLSI